MVFEAAHERFGKLPFAALFGPAARRPGTKAVFTRDDGSWYATGDQFSQPQLAQTIGKTPADA